MSAAPAIRTFSYLSMTYRDFSGLPRDNMTWTRSTIYLPSRSKKHQVLSESQVLIENERIRAEKGSFLHEVLESAVYPLDSTTAGSFKRAVLWMAEDDSALQILRSRPQDLNASDIFYLFTLIDKKVSSLKIASEYAMMIHCRRLFIQFPKRLGDDNLVSEIGYRSSIRHAPRSTKTQASEKFSQHIESPLAPVGQTHALNFNSFAERNQQAFKQGEMTKRFLAQLCEESISAHEVLVQEITVGKSANLNDLPLRTRKSLSKKTLSFKTFQKLPNEKKFKVALWYFEIKNYHLSRPGQLMLALTEIDELKRFSPKSRPATARECMELMLSDYYLPRNIIISCFIALQLETHLNAETITSLTLKSVQKSKDGYIITGTKSRVDAIISKSIDIETNKKREQELYQEVEITKSIAIKALQLLMNNAEAITRAFKVEDPLLLTHIRLTARKGSLRCGPIRIDRALTAWCTHYNIPKFDSRYLRLLGAQVEYLSPDGNIYSVQAKLNHRDIGTTYTYLNTNINKWLHQSNIRRYMDMIAASIYWRTGRDEKLLRSGLNIRNFKTNLLFPIESGKSKSNNIVDQWLESAGSKIISMGIDEIQQCAYQFVFYKKQVEFLAGSNPAAFIKYHIPRILICLAMKRIINESIYANILREAEKNASTEK